MSPGPQPAPNARWDADAVRDEVRAYAAEHLGAEDGVLNVDETGFLKKGQSSAGVQRQYTGTVGRIENAQVGLFLALATSPGRALIDRRLYLPEHSRSNDRNAAPRLGYPRRCNSPPSPVGLGDDRCRSGCRITAPWVTGDVANGQDPQLHAALEACGTGYVLAVACSMRVRINRGRTAVRADTVAARLPATAWQRHSAGNGAKGPRYYDLAWIHTGTDSHHLLIRRNRTTGELAFFLCWSLTPGHRHVTLTMRALAFLTSLAADAAPKPPAGTRHFVRSRDPSTLTVPEIRHLLVAVFTSPAVSAARLLHWSTWRRRHQATARRSHHQRTAGDRSCNSHATHRCNGCTRFWAGLSR
ncbi:transposase [Streptomyces sp. GbtcB6]|uniref:IS701 family transposase n=1 Tax=Streptomyces sp. GbtcB6 TaxID=2824751 RepID=UPI001C3068FE|nr:transposase [Streptomyces sp. GbtcB6]